MIPLLWKLLTSFLAEKVYAHLSAKNMLLNEQMRCRKKSRGAKDQHLIDKQIVRHCKQHQRNLAIGWIDYKKVYDMVPHSQITEPMKMVEILDKIVNLFENSRKTRRAELSACNERLWKVDISRGIYQGSSVLPLLFVVVLISLLIIFNETNLGYITSRNQKQNCLFFKDDLRMYAKSEAELDWLIQIVRIFFDEVGMYLVWTSVQCWF